MRKCLLAVFAGLLVFATAACADDGLKVQATADFLASAAQRTADTRTGRLEMVVTGTIEGQDVTFSATGAFDYALDRMQLELDLAPLAAQFGASDPSVASLLGESVELRLMDGVMYMHFPLLASVLGAEGKEWVSVTTGEVAAAPGDLGPGASADPEAFLEYLRGAGSDVRDLGHEEVRGVDTTHFSATIVPRRAIEAAPEELRDRVRDQLTKLGASGDELLDAAIPIDVYIDRDGLVRRIEMQLPLSIDDSGSGSNVRMDFFDFGAPVAIEAPAPDQVLDVTDQFNNPNGLFAN